MFLIFFKSLFNQFLMLHCTSSQCLTFVFFFKPSQECHRSLDTGDDHLTRQNSTSSKIFDAKDIDYMKHPTNLIKGKSMPSLRYVCYCFFLFLSVLCTKFIIIHTIYFSIKLVLNFCIINLIFRSICTKKKRKWSFTKQDLQLEWNIELSIITYFQMYINELKFSCFSSSS